MEEVDFGAPFGFHLTPQQKRTLKERPTHTRMKRRITITTTPKKTHTQTTTITKGGGGETDQTYCIYLVLGKPD